MRIREHIEIKSEIINATSIVVYWQDVLALYSVKSVRLSGSGSATLWLQLSRGGAWTNMGQLTSTVPGEIMAWGIRISYVAGNDFNVIIQKRT